MVRLDVVPEKITSIERRLDELDNSITECQNQLMDHASKMNEHGTLLGQAGQFIGKKAADFTRAIERMHILEGKFQDLKTFQDNFEQIRKRLVEALGAPPEKMHAQSTLTTEQQDLKEETAIPSDAKISDTKDFHKSRMHYP